MTIETEEYISLKWGTLKAWNLTSEKCRELMRRYIDLGASMGAMSQHDTPEQKELICQIIDECSAQTIHLDWDDIYVSKAVAKLYVMGG